MLADSCKTMSTFKDVIIINTIIEIYENIQVNLHITYIQANLFFSETIKNLISHVIDHLRPPKFIFFFKK